MRITHPKKEPFAFDALPAETIIGIALKMDLPGLYNLCLTNKRINSLLCNNELFWKNRFKHYFSKPVLEDLRKSMSDILVFGSNLSGQLGLADVRFQHIPVKLPNLPPVLTVSAGENHTVIVGIDGSVWGSGRGFMRGTRIPIRVPFHKYAKMASAGRYHTLIIDTDGKVWAFGRNEHGQLGLGNRTMCNVPTQLSLPKARLALSGSQSDHSVVIGFDGTVWTFGLNEDGQLGLGNTTSRSAPTQVSFPETVKVKDAALGQTFTLLLDTEGRIWSFGKITFSSEFPSHCITTPTLGLFNRQAKAISAGPYHIGIIDLEDKVWVFGSNRWGELGLGDNRTRMSPTQIPGLKIKNISFGTEHTVVITSDPPYKVYVFGRANTGRLGLTKTKAWYNHPVRLPGVEAMSISAAGDHTVIVGKRTEE